MNIIWREQQIIIFICHFKNLDGKQLGQTVKYKKYDFNDFFCFMYNYY